MKQYLLRNSLYYLFTLLIAFSLKYHYSRAGSEDLVWILGPTTGVVEYVSGIHFEKESGAGYINPNYRIIIAPSCAGVNFLIAAFCMAMFSSIHQIHRHSRKFLCLFTIFVSAYLVTLTANALRIMFAIMLYHTELTFLWFTTEQIHRLEGILVYLFFLCSYYCLLHTMLHRYAQGADKNYTRNFEQHVSLYTPIFWYLLIALLVPFVNSVHHGNLNRFVEHSIFVFIGCALVLCPFMLIKFLKFLE